MTEPTAIPVTDALLRQWPLPQLDPTGGKEIRGSVLVAGGSAHMPGSVLLTAEAALRIGAGRVRILTDSALVTALAVCFPEAWVSHFDEHFNAAEHTCQAVVIGPGLANQSQAQTVVSTLAKHPWQAPVVLDAFAMFAAASWPERSPENFVLTPHAGEMAALLDCSKSEVLAHPATAARLLAEKYSAVVMLKGARTWITSPEGGLWVSDAGCLGLGTAGSGDVLAGMVAGLLAQGATSLQAAVWATHVHGRCGEVLARHQGHLGFLARELLPLIPRLRVGLSQ